MPVIESLLVRCRHFLRGIFRRDDVERELREEFDGYLVAVARTVADPGRAAAPLRAAVADVDADQAVFNVRTMEDPVSSSTSQ